MSQQKEKHVTTGLGHINAARYVCHKPEDPVGHITRLCVEVSSIDGEVSSGGG